MKRIFLLIFVACCMLIFYQMILGTNGLIEGYKIKKEKEKIIEYKLLLEKYRDDLIAYIKYLKTSESSMEELANRMGFFKDGEIQLIKIIDKNSEHYANIEESKIIEKVLEIIEKDDSLEKEFKVIRTWVTLIFFVFFAGFIMLIIFTGIKDEKNY